MKSKLLIVSAFIIVGATGVACKKTIVSNGGSGGTGGSALGGGGTPRGGARHVRAG